MLDDPRRFWLLLVGAVAGYVVLMTTNPARHSLRDGLRCVMRYRQILGLPAAFALAHSAFRLWRRIYETRVATDAPPVFAPWSGWQPPPSWQEALAAGWLPGLESTSSIFNCIVTTFPLSALAAGLFLGNWRGYQGSLYRGLRRRFGFAGSLVIHPVLLLSAVAAVMKPALFGGLPSLSTFLGSKGLLSAGEVVDSLSFVFEYLLGVGVQIYLILLCFAWVRGLTFDFDALRRFALRRFAFVVKWSVMVIVVSGAGINVPLIVRSLRPALDSFQPDWTDGVIHATRWFLSVSLLVFCSMQILLVFHNESLLQALADHFRLLRRYGGYVGWLMLIVALHFLVLALVDAFLPLALGSWTMPGVTWSLLVQPLAWTALASWFVASWVCLFRRCEHNCPDADDLVRF